MNKFNLYVGLLTGAENVGIISDLRVDRGDSCIQFTLRMARCLIEYDSDTNNYFFTEHPLIGRPNFLDDIDYETLVKKLY